MTFRIASVARATICAATATIALLTGPELASSPRSDLVKPANAVIGRPMTPMSYAGVARRTTRRAVIATTPPPTVPMTPACVQVVDAYGRLSYRCP